MSESERTHVGVSVAIVTDRDKQVLLTFNDNWGMFTLPMARRRQGQQVREPATRAAIRAAAAVLGVPVRLVEQDQGPKRVLARLESGRQLKDKVSPREHRQGSPPAATTSLRDRQSAGGQSRRPVSAIPGAYAPSGPRGLCRHTPDRGTE